jgi:AAA+ ATPase superfamily predicted ATPase
MNILNNPFVTIGYVSSKYFCDRKNETKKLIDTVLNGNNVTLISTRRMGKTGLIEHCYNQPEIKAAFYTFFVDIFATKNLNDFVFFLSKNILNQLKPAGQKALDLFLNTIKSLQSEISFDSMGNPSLSIGLGNSYKTEQSLDEIFQYLKKTDKPCLISIDEFQQITKYPETNTEALLRTCIQQSPLTRFIFSGSQRHIMGEMFNAAARPFFASASMLYLSQIDCTQYVAFARQHFYEAGKNIDDEVIIKVYQHFEGVTWYIQKVLNKLFSLTEKGGNCTEDMINIALSEIIDSFEYNYMDSLYRLPDKQSKLLIAIAKDKKISSPASSGFVKRHNLVSASSVQAALGGLLEKDFVTRDENTYTVYDKFLGQWLCDRY